MIRTVELTHDDIRRACIAYASGQVMDVCCKFVGVSMVQSWGWSGSSEVSAIVTFEEFCDDVKEIQTSE